VDSSGSEQGRVVDSCEHINKPSGSKKGRKFLTSLVTIIVSRSTVLRGVTHTTTYIHTYIHTYMHTYGKLIQLIDMKIGQITCRPMDAWRVNYMYG